MSKRIYKHGESGNQATTLKFHNGRYYAACPCGWRTSAHYTERLDAYRACKRHNEAATA